MDKQIVVVCGKGVVGKMAFSAMLPSIGRALISACKYIVFIHLVHIII
jgi:hypothetical protein